MPFDLQAAFRGASKAVDRARTKSALRAANRIGVDVTLVGAPHVENLGRLEIGDGVAIVSEPVQSHLVTAPGAVLRVGARVTIGSGAAIAAHVRVDIEDDAWLGEGVVIMDTDFHATKDHASESGVAAVVIGAGARLGDRVTVLKGARIGRGARVAADSVVAGEVEDGASVAGVPARVVAATAASDADGSVHERVASVVGATFRAEAVSQDDGPTSIRGWDSLGSLRLLVALEDAFGVVLPEAIFARAKTVHAIGDEIAALLESKSL